MPPTIRRSWHDCWKKGATKSCLGVDYICFAHPVRLSECRSRLRELFCPCARLDGRDRSAVHKIRKAVVRYNVPSTARAALVAAHPGTSRTQGERDQHA